MLNFIILGLLSFVLSTATAADKVGVPVSQVKIYDAKNKFIGYLNDADSISYFKFDNRFTSIQFEISVGYSSTNYFQSSDCTGMPIIPAGTNYGVEQSALIPENSYQVVYMADLSLPANDVLTYHSFTSFNTGCQVITNHISGYPGKRVGILKYTPPFHFK